MSWTDIFPILTDKMVETYQEQASKDDHENINALFRINSVHNPKDANHIVSASLFWKPDSNWDQDFPPAAQEIMENPSGHGITSRFGNPWKHYVVPLLEGAQALSESHPEIAFRVYLADDLAFLIPQLTDAGCEVYLMTSSSIRHNPGAMWRFLAMEEENHLITITDSDRAPSVTYDIERTELMLEGGLKFWRVPYYCGKEDSTYASPSTYRTTIACQFGCATSLPIRLLAEAMIWNLQQGHLRDHCLLGEKPITIFGSDWPSYGFDEFFLNTAVYPRVIPEGILTFVDYKDQSLAHWFGLDIEYCTWANPKSEIVYFEKQDDKSGNDSSYNLS